MPVSIPIPCTILPFNSRLWAILEKISHRTMNPFWVEGEWNQILPNLFWWHLLSIEVVQMWTNRIKAYAIYREKRVFVCVYFENRFCENLEIIVSCYRFVTQRQINGIFVFRIKMMNTFAIICCTIFCPSKWQKPKSVQRLHSDAIEWKIKILPIADMNKQLLSEWVNLAKRIILNGDRRTIKKIGTVFAVVVHWNAKNESVLRKKLGLQSKWQHIKETANVFEAFYFSALSIAIAEKYWNFHQNFEMKNFSFLVLSEI